MKLSIHRLAMLGMLFLTLGLQGCIPLTTDSVDEESEPTIEILDYRIEDPQYFVGESIAVNQIDDFFGVLTSSSVLSIAPALPSGLVMDVNNGDISGTPSIPSARTLYTVTIRSNGVQTGVAELNITVEAAVPASNLTYTPNPIVYTAGVRMGDIVPSFSGVISSFSVNPAFPTGLVLRTSSGRIMGTPNQAQAASIYTITGTNPFGSTCVDVTISALPRLNATRLLVSDSAEPVVSTYIADNFPGNVYQRGYELLASQAIDITSTPLGELVFMLDALGEIRSYGTQAGTPRLLGGTTRARVSGANRLELDSTGTRLLVLASGTLSIFSVDALGNLSALESVTAAPSASDLLVHASQPFAYVSNGFAGSVSVYSFSGPLQALPGSAPVAGFADDLTAPGSLPYLHVAETNIANIHSFRIDTSAATAATHLTPVGAPRAVSGGQIEDLSCTPDGGYVYASTGFNGSVEGFAFDLELESLSAAFSTPIGGYVTEIRVDSDARLVYIMDQVQREVSIYRVGDNQLFYSDRSRTRQAPGTMQLVRGSGIFESTDHVFVSNETQNTIDTFLLDRSAQRLVAGVQVSGILSPQGVVFNNTHEVAYVPEAGAGSIRMFSLDRLATTLVPMTPASVPGGELPRHVVLGADERFAYAVDSIGFLRVFTVDPSTGALGSTGMQLSIALNAGPVVVEPTGQFLYLLESGSSQIASYALDLNTGAPTLINRTTSQANPTDLVVLPQGREVFVTGSGSVSALAINALDGSLAAHGTDAPVGMLASSMDIMSQGFNVYVGSAADASISILDVDFQSGVVVQFPIPISPAPLPSGFSDLRVDRDDLYVLVSFGAPSSQLSLFRSQPSETILEVDNLPLSPGTHRIEVNTTR